MDTRTGMIVEEKEIPAKDRGMYVIVNRKLTSRERKSRQIDPYSPCACGSGKKLKFCCLRKT